MDIMIKWTCIILSCCALGSASVAEQSRVEAPRSQGIYRLPYDDGTVVKVFDDFTSHRPQGRIDFFAIEESQPQVGDLVAAGAFIGNEAAVGCAMLDHVHFEVAVPDRQTPIDSGGFLLDNEGGKRERNPQFCNLPAGAVVKDGTYRAAAC